MAEKLNDDVLRAIFSYLNMNTKVEAMKVCQQWRNIIEDMVSRVSIGQSWCANFCENEKHQNLGSLEIMENEMEVEPFDLSKTFPKLRVLWMVVDDEIVRDKGSSKPFLYDGISKIHHWFDRMDISTSLTCIQINLADDEILNLISQKM